MRNFANPRQLNPGSRKFFSYPTTKVTSSAITISDRCIYGFTFPNQLKPFSAFMRGPKISITDKRSKSMSPQDVKAFGEKIKNELQQTKARLTELENRTDDRSTQREIDTVHRLKAKHQQIEKKVQDLRTTTEAKAEQLRVQISAEIASLKASMAELAKAGPRAKAG
jgi:flagellar motor switch/type III secretory pathway protein FliN